MLSAVGAFIVFMLLLFVYINRKFCTDNVGSFPEAGSGCVTRHGSQDTQCEYPCPCLSPRPSLAPATLTTIFMALYP